MRKLSETIYEHVTGNADAEPINEAFASETLRKIQQANPVKWKSLIQSKLRYAANIKLKWDQIKDDELTFLADNTRYIKKYQDLSTLLLWVIVEPDGYTPKEIMAVSWGSQFVALTATARTAKGRLRDKILYRSVNSLKRAVKNGDKLYNRKVVVYALEYYKQHDAQKLIDDRWANKQEAEAFKSNTDVLRANRHRYNEYIAKIRNSEQFDEFTKTIGLAMTKADEAMKQFSAFMETASDSVSWGTVRSIVASVRTIVDLMKDLSNLSDNLNKGEVIVGTYKERELYSYSKTLMEKSEDILDKLFELEEEQKED